jgi:hypothetical protein
MTPGRRFALDTNLIDRIPPGLAELHALADGGQIELVRADVVDTELTTCRNPELRAHLLAVSARLPEQHGVMVLGHSRLDHAVLAGDEDVAVFDHVWSTLFPGRERATARRNDIRDAMQVWTAMRCGADALLTSDGDGKDTGLLDHDEAVAAEFNGFHIWTPAQAWALVQGLLA